MLSLLLQGDRIKRLKMLRCSKLNFTYKGKIRQPHYSYWSCISTSSRVHIRMSFNHFMKPTAARLLRLVYYGASAEGVVRRSISPLIQSLSQAGLHILPATHNSNP